MINYPLLKLNIRSNYKIFLVFAAALSMYIILIVTMFDPALGDVLAQFSTTMPEMMAIFGMNTASSTLLGFISTYLYGFLMVVFPMIYIIMVSSKLVVKHIDRGSMVCFLASPNSRLTFITTQFRLLIFSIIFLIVYCTSLGVAASDFFFPGELDIPSFLILNLGVLGLHVFLGGLCFFASSITNETRTYLSIAAGIPSFQYLIQMLANMGGELENLKYATFFSLFSPTELIAKEFSAYCNIGLLYLMGVVFFITGILHFARRDLSI